MRMRFGAALVAAAALLVTGCATAATSDNSADGKDAPEATSGAFAQDLWIYERIAAIDASGDEIDLTEAIDAHFDEKPDSSVELTDTMTFHAYEALDGYIADGAGTARDDVSVVTGFVETPTGRALAALATPEGSAPVGLDDEVVFDLTFLDQLAPDDPIVADFAFLQGVPGDDPADSSGLDLFRHRLTEGQVRFLSGEGDGAGGPALFTNEIGMAVKGSTKGHFPAQSQPVRTGYLKGVASCDDGSCVSAGIDMSGLDSGRGGPAEVLGAMGCFIDADGHGPDCDDETPTTNADEGGAASEDLADDECYVDGVKMKRDDGQGHGPDCDDETPTTNADDGGAASEDLADDECYVDGVKMKRDDGQGHGPDCDDALPTTNADEAADRQGPTSVDWDFGPAVGRGDPHMRTFDGSAYSLQAVGEFVGARSSDLDLQLRMQPLGESRTVSVITAIALETAGTRVMVDGAAVTVDGKGVDGQALAGSGHSADGITIVRDGERLTISTPDRHLIEVVNRGRSGIDVRVYLIDTGAEWEGLFGDTDGTRDNDMRTSDGSVMSQPVDSDALYSEFADSWRIGDGDSIFTYPDGKSTEDFTDRSFPDEHVTADTLPAGDRARAEAVCRAAGITDEVVLAECILDFAMTGSIDMVRSAQTADTVEGIRSGRLAGDGSLLMDEHGHGPDEDVEETTTTTESATDGLADDECYVDGVKMKRDDGHGHGPDCDDIGNEVVDDGGFGDEFDGMGRGGPADLMYLEGWDADGLSLDVGQMFTLTCPANGTPGPVWGTDHYSDESSLCTAAVHAGKITVESGGMVGGTRPDSRRSFQGSTRNGITSQDEGNWRGSIEFL